MKTPIIYDAEKHLIVDPDGLAIGYVPPSTGPEIVAACNAHAALIGSVSMLLDVLRSMDVGGDPRVKAALDAVEQLVAAIPK